MPLYEYECTSCGREFEKLTRAADRDKGGQCPDCGKPAKRKLSVFAAGKSETGGERAGLANAPRMCGRCGGPGPCASGDF